MEQTINNVNITGVLVKVGFEYRNVGQENESISGSIVLRTKDGSEHEVNYFANKYKKDENKKFTSEVSALFKGYETILNEYKSLETNPECPDVITIGNGGFGTQDYVDKKDRQTMKQYNDVNAKFANRVEEKDIETTPQVATFEVSGIITKMQPEMKKDEATGNGEVHLDIIGYEDTLIPIKFIVPAAIVEPFGSAGFYEGGFAKFTGNLINTKTSETIVEKQAFGADNVKTVTTTVKRFEVAGGSPLGSIYDIKDCSDEAYEAAKSKRRLKLQEIKTKFLNKGQDTQQTGSASTTPSTQNVFGSTPTVTSTGESAKPTANPFTKNPFAK